MIDANGNYVIDVAELTRREDGHTVTATVTPSGTVTYAVDDGDGKRAIGEELPWDGVTCAALVERLKLIYAAYVVADAYIEASPCDPDITARQRTAYERYNAVVAALPPSVALP